MEQAHSKRLWLPYFVAIVGIMASCTAWYWLTYHLDSSNAFETYHPYVVLSLGVIISILIAILIAVTQLAKRRSQTLNEMNENLKKEIAERMAAEETKQKLEVALLQGQKLQAIGTLAGGIAHDFNNLLYAIIGYVGMTRDDVVKDSLGHKNLGKVMEAAHKGQELVSRILAFSRRQHHEFEALNLKTTIEAALALLRPTIPASVMLKVDLSYEAKILGNQTQIHQILVNLINNAVDAMDGEGLLTIQMSRIPAGDAYLKQFPETLAQDYCKIEIKDTGHGMDQATMERIFEPFYTTKEVGKGTGLGLSIVHTIIKDHQGEISVNSQIGHGTTFTLLLPECVQ